MTTILDETVLYSIITYIYTSNLAENEITTSSNELKLIMHNYYEQTKAAH